MVTPYQRKQYAFDLALSSKFRHEVYNTSQFSILCFSKIIEKKFNNLRIYFEGDGFAWVDSYNPSKDPTPKDPIGLRLAIVDNAENVFYISRPCQFLLLENKKACTDKLWTNFRFSEEVISNMNEILSNLKEKYNIKTFTLIGYSGGGTVAALVASRRNDVDSIVTISGNLDHKYWSYIHDLTPLSGSLNPIDFVDKLKEIKQIHYAGENDKIVPPIIGKHYKSVVNSDKVQLKIVPNQDHSSNWVDFWKVESNKNIH